jgi:calcineurin-like phosphoesterase family protein
MFDVRFYSHRLVYILPWSLKPSSPYNPQAMKLLHFTDSHLQLIPSPESQFHVQPFWRGEAGVLFDRIGRAAEQSDAIVFTGDATHGGGKAEAGLFFDLLAKAARGKPVFMVLGNHDVVNPRWKEHFYDQAGRFSNITIADGIYPLGDIDVLLMHCGYVTADNRVEPGWHPEIFPMPGLSDESAAQFDAALAAGTRPIIAATHCPTHLLPPSASGFAGYVGSGMDDYRAKLNGLLDRHPQVRCMLSGHIHFNSSRVYGNGRVHQSLASVAEYPCQVRLVEMTPTKLESRLINLAAESDRE